VLNAGDAINPRPFGLFFLTDYLRVKTTVDYYSGYWSLSFIVVILFCFLYLPYLFLVWKGFFTHEVLSTWTGLLLVGAFGCLIVPFCALEYWHRWMFMLVYPFTFYAVSGLKRVVGSLNGRGFGFSFRLLHGKVKSMLILTALLGAVYLATPTLMGTVNVGIFALNPINKFFSFAPTVPYGDVDNVVMAMEWLNQYMEANSCVILHEAFLWWGKLYLDDSKIIIFFMNDIDSAVNIALSYGFNKVYFVWWNAPLGWYDITVPKSFNGLRDFGRITVFSCEVEKV
jgi:hypothetical protein